LLDEFLVLFVQRGDCGCLGGILFGGAVLDVFGRVRCILWLGWLCVMELVEGFCNVSRHGEIDFAMHVVPVEMDADVMFASPIGAERIIRLKGRL
jgi:hypothetical protein